MVNKVNWQQEQLSLKTSEHFCKEALSQQTDQIFEDCATTFSAKNCSWRHTNRVFQNCKYSLAPHMSKCLCVGINEYDNVTVHCDCDHEHLLTSLAGGPQQLTTLQQ